MTRTVKMDLPTFHCIERIRESGAEQSDICRPRPARRGEFVFKLFYQLYRVIHRVLVGFDIRVGNFSVVPSQFLERLGGYVGPLEPLCGGSRKDQDSALNGFDRPVKADLRAIKMGLVP